MATLRNKTTESGVIVLWKPHPDHNRPSTYQVTTRGVRFLETLGFDVPRPGDECEIPWEACHPLRVLGDLHFKSETPGEVSADNAKQISTFSSSALSVKQERELRTYIESHPSADGVLDSTLEYVEELPAGDSSGESGQGGDHPTEMANSSRESKTEAKSTDIETRELWNPDAGLLHHAFGLGRVDRVSGSGNAILEDTQGKERNLGPLPRRTVGEWTLGVRLGGHWHLCLTPQLWDDRYRNLVRKKRDVMEEKGRIAGLDKLLDIRDMGSADEFGSPVVNVFVSIVRDGVGVGYKGPWTVIIVNDYLVQSRWVRVEIVDERGPLLIARPTVGNGGSSEWEESEVMELHVAETLSDAAVGTVNNTLVIVPGETLSRGQTVSVATENCKSEFVVARVDTLPPDCRPVSGELVTFEEGSLPEYPNIPVETPTQLPDVNRPLQLVVNEVRTDHIEVAVPSAAAGGPLTLGDRVEVEILDWNDDGATGVVNGVPVVVPDTRYLIDTTIEADVVEITDSQVRASFRGVVIAESEAAIDELIERADQASLEQKYGVASRAATSAVERTEKAAEPETWVKARFRELMVSGLYEASEHRFERAKTVVGNGREDISTMSDTNELSSSYIAAVDRLLGGLELIIDAMESAAEIDSASTRVEETELWAKTKRESRKAVQTLTSEPITKCDQLQSPHPTLVHKIAVVAGGLMSVPDEVEEFLEQYEVDAPELVPEKE